MSVQVQPAQSPWIVCPRPNAAAKVRLFCFASAGHGPSMFRSWAALVRSDVELSIIQLPGRESRWTEAPLVRLADLLPALTQALEPRLDRPFAFFGHSLGALIAFETARHLRRARALTPCHLFASAHRAPQIPNRHPRISHLPDRHFVAEVNARHGGVPDAVAENRELMDLMLPSLKADYRLFEDYEYAPEEPLNCPLSAFGGSTDVYVTSQDIAPWEAQTTGRFELRIVSGGHFFVNDAREHVVATVMSDLARPS
jgi:medium-chain acyl-[acyl-carrier-protein] hydrolase